MMKPIFLFNNTVTHVRWLSSHDTIDTYSVVVSATYRMSSYALCQ
jgi:hypothetical protein